VVAPGSATALNDLRSLQEAEIAGEVWRRRHSVERYDGLVDIEALTLRGTFPDTVLEITWRALCAVGDARDVMVAKLWRRGHDTPESTDVAMAAEDVIEDLYLRAIGD